jgi:hypothetical protein
VTFGELQSQSTNASTSTLYMEFSAP